MENYSLQSVFPRRLRSGSLRDSIDDSGLFPGVTRSGATVKNQAERNILSAVNFDSYYR